MKKYSYTFILVALLFATFTFGQKADFTIAQRWEMLKQFTDNQLPESALKEVEKIMKQAQKEKNFSEAIKAQVYKMRFTLEKNPEEAPKLIHDFEVFTENCTDIAEKALLHSMTAELYAQFYQKEAWKINRRTEIVGKIPNDMKEWTKNIFFNKITQHLEASMADAVILQNTDALKLATLLEKGEDSRILQPTLFDFLVYRRISILESLGEITSNKNPLEEAHLFDAAPVFSTLKLNSIYQISPQNQILKSYQELLTFRLKSKNESALLFADLERLKFLNKNSDIGKESLYLMALNRLEKLYNDNETVVELLAEKANFYLQNYNSAENKTFKRQAFEICADGINRFSNYKRIALLKNIQKEIATKTIHITYKSVTKPNSSIELEVKSQNIDTLQLTVYKVNATAQEYYTFKQNGQDKRVIYTNRNLLFTRQITINTNPNFEEVKTKIETEADDFGIYEFCLEEKGNEKNENRIFGTFTTTDLASIDRCTEAMKSSNYVLDRKSGTPQREVKVAVYNRNWTKQGYVLTSTSQYITDKNGACQINLDREGSSNQVIFFQKGKDAYFSSASQSYFSIQDNEIDTTTIVSIYTDRSIYRPGQTVYFKAIAYCSNKTKQQVAAGKSLIFTLMDANWQVISNQQLKTNLFGSVSGEFVLPLSVLNGNFMIKCGYFNQSISVEEYKRPTFEVKIESPKAEVNFGQELVLKGDVKAFAGYGVGNAKVKYRITKTTHRHCWWCNDPDKVVSNGTTTSNAEGGFELKFTPEKAKSKLTNPNHEQIFSYTLSVEVTDLKGETQQGECGISVGDRSLFILSEIAKKIDKHESLSIPISTETLNGENINSNITYSLKKMQDTTIYDEKLNKETELKELTTVLSGNFSTQNKNLNLDLSKLLSGRYKFILTTKDSQDRAIETEQLFILYDQKEKRPPVNRYVWLLSSKTECEIGEKSKINFGTSTDKSAVLYEIMHGNSVLESRWISFSNEIKTFEIPFKEAYGSGVNVRFTFMKDEQLFTESITLKRKVIEKKLTPSLNVFRNQLHPGEKAAWTITIPETANKNRDSELMVGMYDASLEVLRPHSWRFNPAYNEQVLHSPTWSTVETGEASNSISINVEYENSSSFNMNKLNWFGFSPLYYESSLRMSITGSVSSQRKPLLQKMGKDINGAAPEFNSIDSNIAGIQKMIHSRTNFKETAFFYPQLRTDSLGNVKFSFTVPESLTRWNVKMLAHTKDLYFGQGEAQVVTQKELMVQMNLPRFVRRSDRLVLSANVINLTDKELSAVVQFEMIDPANEKVIALKDAAVRKVSLVPNATQAVEWELTEFSPYELVTCKVIAQAGNFSDGEQKYLPVLPDKVLVTESIPLVLRGNETRTFNFENLLQNGSKVDNKSLTVEFSSNPTWYAIQALPTLSTPENDNAFDYLTAYYVNRLAGHIVRSNPKIKSVFEQWKQTGGSREALLSNMEKNAELKNVLLEETPWVMAAKNETEQKRQIALLFDLNQQENHAEQYLDKLKELQLPSGGFSWFKGMSESRYVTQAILMNLGRLNRFINRSEVGSWKLEVGSQVLKPALRYLDLEIAKDFENMKRYNKNYEKGHSIDNIQLFYLHLRSEFPEISIAESAQEAVQFYKLQSETYWTNFSLYGKAMAAVVAQRNGKVEIAKKIVQSLKENALKTDELGMYWAKNSTGYFWNERPIAVQTALIEAFAEVTRNQSDLDEMKIWLLKQKQTQCWDSPLSSVDAIYALVKQGADWLSQDGKVEIKLGTTTLPTKHKEAGTGYFKQTIPSAEIQPSMGKVTVAADSSGHSKTSIGWGAVYWQYFQSLENIIKQTGSLNVSKKLFVEKVTTGGKQLLPIEQTMLKKGDKVVTRLVITTDRNLDFVALKDLRAACFESVEQLSGYNWKEGVGYYKSSKDASTQFFFSHLPKGTYVFEYELCVNSAGSYSSGLATVQCLYAPEFLSHSGGERITVSSVK